MLKATHILTIDVEDWYHGISVAGANGRGRERRLDIGLEALLELCASRQVFATFFILGTLAREYPMHVRRIVQAGHEVGCHGWAHEFVYRMTPARFEEDTRRARDTNNEIVQSPVLAYRAPYFSITPASQWALPILAKLGFTYDSSIFPVCNWRYGFRDFGVRPRLVRTACGVIRELPIGTRRLLGRSMPVGGGAYLRIYPCLVTRDSIRAIERDGRPCVLYVHPWELDRHHPRVAFDWRAWITHYANLGCTAERLGRLLTEFSFGPLCEVGDAFFARDLSPPFDVT